MNETIENQPATPPPEKMPENRQENKRENRREKMPPLSQPRVQISGARALANLLLLEHDFRRTKQQMALARLMVEQLRHFTHYDCAVFWLASPYGRVKQLVISGVDETPDNKLMQQWGRAAAKWLAKALAISLKKAPKNRHDKGTHKADSATDSKTDSSPDSGADSSTDLGADSTNDSIDNLESNPQAESTTHHIIINADTIPDKIFNIWLETVPMNGLCVPIKTPSGKLMGGLLLLRDEAWSLPVRILLDQMAEAAAYSLCAIGLGIYGKKGGWARRLMRGLLFLFLAFLLVVAGLFLADFI